MIKKQITIDDLAGMVKRGFDEMATKDDLKGLATKDDLKGLATIDMLKTVVEGMDIMRADIRDIKITLGPLVRMVAGLDTDVEHLTARVVRLEQKIGLVK